MISLFVTILNMSITASIVALAVILIRMPLKKVPKIFSYALWSVVLFRLVFPFSIENVFRLILAFARTASVDTNLSQNLTLQGEQFIEIPTDVSTYTTIPTVSNGINFSYTFFQIASFIWLIGFVVLLLYGIIGYVRLKRHVYFATRVRDNIFETDKIKTPFVLGLMQPKIYFPTYVDPLQHDYILMHEQTHIKRCDYLIKPFAYAVLALHWFNPLIWLSYFLMSKDMEMSCDEAVLRKTNVDIRKDYATSLFNLSMEKKTLISPIAFGESNVHERVMNVLKFKKSKKGITVASLIAVCIFAIGFASNLTTLAMINEPDSEVINELDSETTRIFDTPTIVNDPIPISEFEEMIEGFRNIPAIFQPGELFAIFEELLAESIREGRDYVIIDIEDLMALEGSFSISANDLGFDLGDFHLFDTNGFDLEDFHLIDTNDLGFDLEDFHLIDINDLGYSLEGVHIFSNDLGFNDFLGMAREEALAHVRDQLVENGHMTEEQADRLESLPFD